MDLDVIKQRLDSMQSNNNYQSGERKNIFWKPTVGRQTIRVVPSKFNSAMPFTEMMFYYNIGDARVMPSPSNYTDDSGEKRKDPIIEFTKQLRTTSDSENWKLAKQLDPKVRYFAPIVVRGEESEGVKIWQFGKELYETFLQLAVDEEVGDYTDITNGRDIKLVTVGPEVTGTKYNKTTASPSMKQSPLFDDAALVKSMIEDQVNPKDLFKNKVLGYDEMKANLAKWLNPEDSAQEGDIIDEDKTSPNNNYSISTSATEVKQTKLDKFDSLFADESSTDDLPF